MKASKAYIILFISLFLIFSCSKEEEPTGPAKNVILPAPSPQLTTVSSSTNHIISDGNTTCTVEVYPINKDGELLGGTLDNVEFSTDLGHFTGEVQYNSSSKTYYQTLAALEGETGYATVKCEANWIDISDTAYVKFYLGVYVPDDNFLELLQEAVGDDELKTYEIYEEDLAEVTTISGGSDITFISGIEYCTSLENLEITGNSISDLTPLSEITTLTSIEMENNEISDISALSNLQDLETLILARNSIVNITTIGSLTKLVELNLSRNQIVHIPSEFANLTNLETLNLSYNNIDIPTFSSMENLTNLNLSHNELANINSLSNLITLTSLNLEADSLIDISPLEDLTELTTLNLKNNSISDISVLEYLENLEYIDLSGNLIIGIEPLVNNDSIDSGDEIDLRDNPLNEDTINIHIPALEDRGVTVLYDTET